MPSEAIAFVVGLAWLLAQVGTIVMIYSRLRRQPPINEDLARNYATKSDLEKTTNEWRAHCQRTHGKLDGDLTTDKTHRSDIAKEQFALIRTGQNELRNIIDDFRTDVTGWQRSVERQIGALEERTRRP